jgi:3-methyl-2-oxobutanoate hydroxymethyltransferase
MEPLTLPALRAMKRDGRKIVGVVAWDAQIARILDRAGVDVVSVGDSVGVNLWGRDDPLDVTMDEMLLLCRAVRSGAQRALVSCDFPYGPLQAGTEAAASAARRLVEDGGADIVKLDGAADFPEAVAAIASAGIPVFAQFGSTPQTGSRSETAEELVAQAKLLEDAGAALLDFTHSGPVAGPAVVAAVSIPVIGGLGGGPWLDGRMRMIHRAIGYGAAALDAPPDAYANVAQVAYDAIAEYADDVRGGRQIKGG